jgi:hypothetical protein
LGCPEENLLTQDGHVIDSVRSTSNLNVSANFKLCAKTLLGCETIAHGKMSDKKNKGKKPLVTIPLNTEKYIRKLDKSATNILTVDTFAHHEHCDYCSNHCWKFLQCEGRQN